MAACLSSRYEIAICGECSYKAPKQDGACVVCEPRCASNVEFNDLKSVSTLNNATFHSLNVADLLTPFVNSSDIR